MHITNRLSGRIVLFVCCVLGVAPGCKDEEGQVPKAAVPATAPASPTTGPVAAATTAPVPEVAAVDVPAVLEAGGKNWSSVGDGEPVSPGAPAAGTDYWIWPAEDVAYVPGRGANATLAVKLNWRLRPGGKPAGEALYGTIASAAAAAGFTLRGVAADFDGRAEGGVVEVRVAPWKVGVAGDVTLFASRPGSSSAISNVLRLKVAPPTTTTAEEKGN